MLHFIELKIIQTVISDRVLAQFEQVLSKAAGTNLTKRFLL